jgi:hypothetical protein
MPAATWIALAALLVSLGNALFSVSLSRRLRKSQALEKRSNTLQVLVDTRFKNSLVHLRLAALTPVVIARHPQIASKHASMLEEAKKLELAGR